MEVITRQKLANGAASRWRCQYNSAQVGDEKYAIWVKLRMLGSSPSPDDIDEAIGNKTWTTPPKCAECGAMKSIVVRVGEEPDYESETVHLCEDCVSAALSAIKGTPQEGG